MTQCDQTTQFVRLLYLWLAGYLQLSLCVRWSDMPTLGQNNIPRVVLRKDISADGFEHHETFQNHTVLLIDEDSQAMYAAGIGAVLKLDVDNLNVIQTFPLNRTHKCSERGCGYVITVIEKFEGSLFVCATNGIKPLCWKLHSPENAQTPVFIKSYDGKGISPLVYTDNSLSLIVEGDIYAATESESSSQFRRRAGIRTGLFMDTSWVSEPTFISASWVQQKDDPDNEKIYIFFREKSSDSSREADPWISRVARVCKIDEGGPKKFLQNVWTSFLKARLICGFPDESLYFNHLQDAFVLHGDEGKDTKVYALFTSSWNSTAVCVYSIASIEELFETADFKDGEQIPSPRPGACIKDSKTWPIDTLIFYKDHVEMGKWVHSMHKSTPFYVSSSNYTKITVDRVQAADETMHNILLLSTDSGKIHKVLETDSGPFIISETQFSGHSAIQSMKLVSTKKKLALCFSQQVVNVDLQTCQEYNKSCAACVLARDPYCAWTTFGCSPTVAGGIQNIRDGKTHVCRTSQDESSKVNRTRRQTVSLSAPGLRTNHSVPLNVPFYLTCPIDSYHAVYTWEHRGNSSPCLQMQSSCLHLIPAMVEESYGDYECVSKERDYTKVVTRYQLTKEIIQDEKGVLTGRNIPNDNNRAAAVAPQRVWVIVPVLVVVLGLHIYFT